MRDFWEGFWEGFWVGVRRTPAIYFRPVIVGWRWLKRGARVIAQGSASLARAGWRAIGR